MDDFDVLGLVEHDCLLEYLGDNINDWHKLDQEFIADKLDSDVIENEADERDLMPTFKDNLGEMTDVEALGEMLNFGSTSTETDWLSKKLEEMKASIGSSSYLDEV